jgi:hypothetical protein
MSFLMSLILFSFFKGVASRGQHDESRYLVSSSEKRKEGIQEGGFSRVPFDQILENGRKGAAAIKK